jgi:hypothetical protein
MAGEDAWRRGLSLRFPSPDAVRMAACGLALALASPPGWGAPPERLPADGLQIEHTAPACVAAERYARLSACFRPPGALARGRVHFRADGVGDWFYVEMIGQPPCLQAVLPRPRADLAAIEYYVSGVDRELAETRTAALTVPVSASDTCDDGSVAPVVESEGLVIGSSSGAEPAGFLTGRGLPTGLILGVAGGAAAVATVVVLARDGEGDDPTSPSPGITAAWTSELSVPGAEGQVVLDGRAAALPGPGAAALRSTFAPGLHHVEGMLTRGSGRPGSWRFDLAGLGVTPGSLRVLSGEATGVGPDQLAFRLGGHRGERVAFSFVVGRP